MWLLVYCNESKSYSVISSSGLPDAELEIGAAVNVVQNAEIVFMSPNRAICERQYSILKKTPSLYKPCASRPKLLHTETAKKDVVETKLDRIIAYLTSFELRLQKLADRQIRMESDLITLVGDSAQVAKSSPQPQPPVPKVEPARAVQSCAKSRPPKTLTYPYCLTKQMVDDLYRSKHSATAFARAIERELFFDDEDRDVNLDKRRDQDKVRWLRDLVREWYPAPTFSAEASLWSACQIAINDYHRKKRKSAFLSAVSSSMERPSQSDSPEWLDAPPQKCPRRDVNDSSKIHHILSQIDDDEVKVYATDLL